MDSLPPGIDLCAVPATTPPDSQTASNLTDPVSLSITTLVISSILLALSCITVVIRTWTNRHRLRWSDHVAVVALFFHAANVGIIMSLHRYNRHQWDLPVCWFDASYLKRLYAQVLTFGTTLLLSKAAILLLYLDIFGIKRDVRIAVCVGLAANTMIFIPFIPMASYYNAPHAGQPWESITDPNRAQPLLPWAVATGIASVILDVYIFVLPLPVIRQLSMSASKRFQLMAVFGMALMGVVAGIVAMAYRIELLIGASDSTWYQASVAISNVAENSVALIVGSGPALANYFKAHIAKTEAWVSIRSVFRSTQSGRQSSEGSSKTHRGRPLWTFGSPRADPGAQPKNGWELTDPRPANSVATALYDRSQDDARDDRGGEHGYNGVVKTVTVSQLRRGRDSTDRLV
ncbi:hypothetical protein PG997_013372 [Apiospora hydei]|uniref:Rhodopsin domain-containing protein n=1 Tax=Apiospora hydei TaxID=1337664 RepID=A0ABR1V5Z6_9PEZI